ncbi:MAG: hypothetical protein M3R12_13175 [Actinomycetota bacterium]|nr:hypothetical protein [Actinomycetota bacterium]
MPGSGKFGKVRSGGTVFDIDFRPEVPVHARPVALIALAGLCLTATAAGSVDAGASLRFGFVPQRAFQGQPASLSVVVRPTGVRCAASVRYADRSLQKLPTVVARAGKAAWRWQIPAKAKLGSATATVSCGRAGASSRSFAVVGPPSAPAKVVIGKNGFSQRVRSTSRSVSYGIELANPSPENDALDVDVLVNFVDATNRVVDTDTVSVDAIAAGSRYYLGGSTSIPDASPVSKLEIVTRIGGQAPKRKLGPAFADVIVQAQKGDPAWVGAVVGQVENDHPTMLLRRTQISTVIYDSAGEVIGGSTGGSSGGLLPGVRAYFQASSGVSSIPFDRVASASVSVLGSYEPTS